MTKDRAPQALLNDWGIRAALDRQHPRDLFGIMHLQAAGPIPDQMRQAFVAYLAGHRRPIAELLMPNSKAIEDLFANHFVGMTDEPIELADLDVARKRLFEWAATALSEHERRFLLSSKQGEPDWTLLPFEGLDQWPAIQWKLHNIRQMSSRAHKAALARMLHETGAAWACEHLIGRVLRRVVLYGIAHAPPSF